MSLLTLTAAAIALTNLKGDAVRVLPSAARKGVVAFFVMAECPIANAFAPEMSKIAQEFGAKGWQFYLVHVDSIAAVADLAKHAREYGYTFPVLRDPAHQLVKLAGATKTPEAAVFSTTGTLLYRGRIDDRYYGLGQMRPQPRERTLRLTLAALTAGKPAPTARTEAIGCFIPTK
jgi:peroxiredoxin